MLKRKKNSDLHATVRNGQRINWRKYIAIYLLNINFLSNEILGIISVRIIFDFSVILLRIYTHIL